MTRLGEYQQVAMPPIAEPLHLGDIPYCLNVFEGTSWESQFLAIKTHLSNIRRELNYTHQPFAIGLRLSNQATKEINLAEFKNYCDGEGLRVTTINAFPYGDFHVSPVKQRVYQPDWTTIERCDYTRRVLNILQELLPANTQGSVSTVPLGYPKNIPFDFAKAYHNLQLCSQEISRNVILALEPEPDCILSRTDDVLQFFTSWDLPRTIGICYDLCHQYVEFENIPSSINAIKQANIPIGKVQLSSAPSFSTPKDPALATYAMDSTYLHQACIRQPDGSLHRITDLTSSALADAPEGELRVHYHIPLSHKPIPQTLAQYLLELRCPLEIETYTFSVLPDNLRHATIDQQIVAEYRSVSKSFSLL